MCVYILVLVRYSICRSIAILAKVRNQYLVVSRFFDICGIERSLFDIFDTSTSSPFDDVDAKAQHRCRCDDDVVVYGSYRHSASLLRCGCLKQ